MHISFTHPSKAFLPEIDAYTRFFEGRGITTRIAKFPGHLDDGVDVEWYFMGTYFSKKNPGVITIHEYASASVPPFARIKDIVKKALTCRPDFRIYNNAFVKAQFAFSDRIPSGIRDFGIEKIHPPSENEKVYDFIYIGTVENKRKLNRLFECFASGPLQNKTLRVLSSHYQEIASELKFASNIKFEGPVPQKKVIDYLQKARFGINYIPDRHPYNQQTSAKL
ncbi:MAG TPA: hypothetical protein VM012_04005, partial [Flavitalea sp.]|nr:hypothetical protein [Flavitalea sp.]